MRYVAAGAVVAALAVGLFLVIRSVPEQAPEASAASSTGPTKSRTTPVPTDTSGASAAARATLTAADGSFPVAGVLPLDVVAREPGRLGGNAFLRIGGQPTNLTQFDRRQIIFDAAASPDGRWAYVWHCERPPRQLSIYDLQTGRCVHSFVPGCGGTLRWLRNNTILHCWGSGTDCRLWRVYDTAGGDLWGGITCGLDMSLDGRYLATYGTMEAAKEPLRVHDLVARQAVYTTEGLADFTMVERSLDWWKPGEVTFNYRDREGRSNPLTVKLAPVAADSLLAPAEVLVRRFVSGAGGRSVCTGLSITLPQGRFASSPAAERIDIRDAKDNQSLADRMTMTTENEGRTLVMRFLPGKENIGSGNEVIVTVRPEALELLRDLGTSVRWTVPMVP